LYDSRGNPSSAGGLRREVLVKVIYQIARDGEVPRRLRVPFGAWRFMGCEPGLLTIPQDIVEQLNGPVYQNGARDVAVPTVSLRTYVSTANGTPLILKTFSIQRCEAIAFLVAFL
jgi:hypothetical protein